MLVDLNVPQMAPARDPLRSFISHAADRAVREVLVDGREVVAAGKVISLDQDEAGRRLAEVRRRMLEAAPAARLSWSQRRADFAAEPAAVGLTTSGGMCLGFRAPRGNDQIRSMLLDAFQAERSGSGASDSGARATALAAKAELSGHRRALLRVSRGGQRMIARQLPSAQVFGDL